MFFTLKLRFLAGVIMYQISSNSVQKCGHYDAASYWDGLNDLKRAHSLLRNPKHKKFLYMFYLANFDLNTYVL